MPQIYELRFESLFRAGCGLTFPCDERGVVDLDALPDRLRDSYYYAHAMIGHDYAVPRVARRVAAAAPVAA